MKKKNSRLRRGLRVRCHFKKSKVIRLVVHRTSNHIYAQIIDSRAQILVQSSTLEKEIAQKLKNTGNQQAAFLIGQSVAKRAINKDIVQVSFDRSGFQYHGRVKALADGARAQGLKF